MNSTASYPMCRGSSRASALQMDGPRAQHTGCTSRSCLSRGCPEQVAHLHVDHTLSNHHLKIARSRGENSRNLLSHRLPNIYQNHTFPRALRPRREVWPGHATHVTSQSIVPDGSQRACVTETKTVSSNTPLQMPVQQVEP